MACIVTYTRQWGTCVMKCRNFLSNITVDCLICGNLLLSISILIACISTLSIEPLECFTASRFWLALLFNHSKYAFSLNIYPIFWIGALLLLIGLILSSIVLFRLKADCETNQILKIGRTLCLSSLFSICAVILGGCIFSLNIGGWSCYDSKLWSVLLSPNDPDCGTYTMDAWPLFVLFGSCLLYGMTIFISQTLTSHERFSDQSVPTN